MILNITWNKAWFDIWGDQSTVSNPSPQSWFESHPNNLPTTSFWAHDFVTFCAFCWALHRSNNLEELVLVPRLTLGLYMYIYIYISLTFGINKKTTHPLKTSTNPLSQENGVSVVFLPPLFGENSPWDLPRTWDPPSHVHFGPIPFPYFKGFWDWKWYGSSFHGNGAPMCLGSVGNFLLNILTNFSVPGF